MKTTKAIVLTLIVGLWSITFSYGQACYNISGCQNFANFGYNATTAATLEYDNYVSGFHSTVVRDLDGSLKIWGERTMADGVNSWLVPTPINAGNYPGLTGRPLKVAIGSFGITQPQFLLLTDDGNLWAWGKPDIMLSSSLVSTANFQKLSIGLPAGLTAADVKMLFGTTYTVVLTSCSGDVYVLSLRNTTGGDGNIASPTEWSHVQKASGGFLTGIVAARASYDGVIALDASGNLWVWGQSYDGVSAMTYRTKAIPLPAPVTATGNIKMIGVVNNAYNYQLSYYILYENGSLYSLGNNNYGQLGDWTRTTRLSWVQPTYTSGGAPMNDIKWISPNEHDIGYSVINVITNGKVLYNWGSESGNMLGRNSGGGSGAVARDPGQPLSFQAGYANNNIIAAETGGHTTMVLRECTSPFGYAGHRVSGSMGDNSSTDTYDNVYHFNTNAVQVCGSPTVGGSLTASYNGPYCIGNSVQLMGSPSGGTYAIDPGSTATATLNGNTLTFNTAGTLRVNYTITDGSPCGTVTVVKVFAVEDCGAKVTIPGTIWNDVNGNAVINSGEDGIANGLWANLTGPDGNVIASVMVNTDGTYTFQIATSYLAASGNYSVILTNSAKQAGDPLSIAGTPANGYNYTGVNRGATGVDNTNHTGVLNIGDLSTVAAGTTTAPVNFGIRNTPLPVTFGFITAVFENGKLTVNWNTETEINNDHFDIEASADGINFTTIGTVKSKAKDGNSKQTLQYAFSQQQPGAAVVMGIGLLALSGLGIFRNRKTRVVFGLIALSGFAMLYMGCKKTDGISNSSSGKTYIRIAQVDINGTKSYSKTVVVSKP